jgi:hypothetical protein
MAFAAGKMAAKATGGRGRVTVEQITRQLEQHPRLASIGLRPSEARTLRDSDRRDRRR